MKKNGFDIFRLIILAILLLLSFTTAVLFWGTLAVKIINAQSPRCDNGVKPIAWWLYEDPEKCAFLGKEVPFYPKIKTGAEFYEELDSYREYFSPPKQLRYGGYFSKIVHESKGTYRGGNRNRNNE